jgi:hypothetical protein
MDNLSATNPKVNLMWDMLSVERQKELYALIGKTLKDFKKASDKFEYGKMFPLELTKGFDQEEPQQFVYVKFIFRINEIPSSPEASAAQLLFEDIEVFKKDSINHWIDHVDRINKQNSDTQLFYENNIFEEKNVERNQAQISNAIEDGKIEMPKNRIEEFLKNRFIGQNEEVKEDVSNESLFDFFDKDSFKLSNEEYIEMFKSFAKASLNCSADSFIHKGHWGKEASFNNVINNLKTLQSRFSLCDFWTMKQDDLAEMGFVNWANKMMLIPFWAFPVILKNSQGKVLHTRENVDFTIVDNASVDFSNTFGCVTYGIPLLDLKSKI